MKCEYCNLKKGPFKTEKIYSDFIEQVGSLVQRGVLVKLGEVKPAGPFIIFKYKCNMCDKSWLLKVPDQAYRGGWYEN